MKVKYLILVLVLALTCFTGCDDGNVDNSKFVTAKEETLTNEINAIYLEWNSGVINIQKSSDNSIHIEERAKEDFLESNMYTAEISGGQLKVTDPHYHHPVIMLEHDLNLTIPDKMYKEININGTSVQVDMMDFKAENLILVCNTTEHNISGEFKTVSSDFTSGVIDYSFNPMPQSISLKGYVSEGSLKLPKESGFTLKQTLEDSELNDSFENMEAGTDTFVVGKGQSSIDVSLEQSTFAIEPIK